MTKTLGVEACDEEEFCADMLLARRQRSWLPAKRRATIAPNYEYGQSAVAVFKKLTSEKRPDIQWVDEQWRSGSAELNYD